MMTENIPKLTSDTKPQIRASHSTPSRINVKYKQRKQKPKNTTSIHYHRSPTILNTKTHTNENGDIYRLTETVRVAILITDRADLRKGKLSGIKRGMTK